MNILRKCALVALLLPPLVQVASAQSAYPSKTIRLVVPFPPGGTTDILARSVAQELSQSLKQQVVVDNRAGAGGNIGSDVVAKAAPDGYTILMGTVGTHAINASLFAQSGSKMPYDAVKDFAPVSLVAAVPNVMVVNPGVPATTVPEFIAWARSRPGKTNMLSSGNGTSIHLSGELFKVKTQTFMVHIPYRGSNAALVDLIGGNGDVMFDNLPSALPFIRSRRLRALAVTSTKRSPALPDVPTVAEAANLPGFDASSWFGVLAPAGTPKEIVQKLNQEIVRALQTPAVRERLASQGADAVGDSPEEFAAHIQREITKWAEVVKLSGAKID